MYFLVFISISSYAQQYTITDTTNYFTITYKYATPSSVKTILEKTTKQISQFIKTTIPINAVVEWVPIESGNGNLESVEASCIPTLWIPNFTNAPQKNVLYPITLAEKLSGIELNKSTDPDIEIQINSNLPWYLKDDSKTDSTEIDLYTILLHELCHGLGFKTAFGVSNGTGVYLGSGGIPTIFDTFLADKNGKFLTDQNVYPNTSLSLYNVLTSDSLFFSSNYSFSLNNQKRPKLYAPNPFNNGGSIEHLDAAAYKYKDINWLMTPFHDYGEPDHILGPIVEGILADLGWSDHFISVNTLPNTDDMNKNSAVIVSIDSLLNPSSLTLHYSFDNFSNQVTVSFTKTDTVGYYRSTIPSYSLFNHTVDYYVTANDTNNKELGNPSNYPINHYSFYVGADTTRPTINYSPPSSLFASTTDTLDIIAQVTDNIGIDSVWVIYSINYIIRDTVKLSHIKLSEYEAKINLKGSIKENDILMYLIYAVDSSKNHNENAVLIKLPIRPKPIYYTSLQEYFEDTTEAKNLFYLDSFYIAKPEGFSKYCLNSWHPYPSTHIPKTTFNFTATLKNPIILDTAGGAYMFYKEVVLVEPATLGAVFEVNDNEIDNAFFDYCIVEGSKDKINWHGFEDGYKIELHPDWQARYESKYVTIDNRQSSAALGSEDLYHLHMINLLNNKYLRSGDTVYVRFRLFSDAYTNGWGWAIDSITIQPTFITGVKFTTENANIVSIYPTISSGNFIVHAENNIITNCEVFSLQETRIPCQFKSGNDETFLEITASGGLYFVRITLDNGYQITKKVLICSN